jgi:hypothetical protein
MPKRIFEINTFQAGIISDPQDELDIPSSAASTSLNIDPLNDGDLKGIPEVQLLKDTGFENPFSTISYTRGNSYTVAENQVGQYNAAPPNNESG